MSPSSPLPPLPATFTRSGLTKAGFTGWRTWGQLRASELPEVPCTPGAYLVLRRSRTEPRFLARSPAGRLNGKDPTVKVKRLRCEWVDGARVLYIGKADYRSRRASVEALRKRLGEFSKFGAGRAVPHGGGRLIWQLADSAELLIAWHEISWGENARCYEKRLLGAFAEHHGGRLPLANLTG